MIGLDTLTPRDRQVVDLLMQGCSNEEIGRELGISEFTVKQHLKLIGLRLGLGVGRRTSRLRIELVRRFGKFPEPDTIIYPVAWDGLSDNQREVVRLAVDNLSNLEIGKRIGWTESATKNTMKRIFDKLGVFSRLELVVWYGRIFGFPQDGNGSEGSSNG